jgi:BirA family transcriptional regulator, biotin operon repressor / biotin---[acetyl-CoA-carboxylase] ligase
VRRARANAVERASAGVPGAAQAATGSVRASVDDCVPPGPADLDVLRRFGRDLRTAHLGRSCEVHPVAISTNDLALARLAAGAPHGHLVVADEQTGGRGRRGRAWHSPPGVAIHASLVLRGERPLAAPTALVAAVALGIAEGLEASAEVGVGIKWPNDLWVGGRKVAGILVEARGYVPAAPAVVVGFGVNVSTAGDQLPADLRDVATSLVLASGRAIDRGAVLRAVLEALEPRVERVLAGGADPRLHEDYRARSVLLGRRVELLDADRPLRGTVADLSATDGLLLRTDDGACRHVPAEHVRDVRLV